MAENVDFENRDPVEDILSMRKTCNYKDMPSDDQKEFDHLAEMYIESTKESQRWHNKSRYMNEWEDYTEALKSSEKSLEYLHISISSYSEILDRFSKYADEQKESIILINAVKAYFDIESFKSKDSMVKMCSILEVRAGKLGWDIEELFEDQVESFKEMKIDDDWTEETHLNFILLCLSVSLEAIETGVDPKWLFDERMILPMVKKQYKEDDYV